MTSPQHGHEFAETFGRRLSLKEVQLSSVLFVFICVHSWFVLINDQPFFLERICPVLQFWRGSGTMGTQEYRDGSLTGEALHAGEEEENA